MSDGDDRIRTLEVLVTGNGSPGILQRTAVLEKKVEKVEDRQDMQEFKIEQAVSRESCLMNQKVMEKAISKGIADAFANRQNSGMRYVLEWITKMGPVLASIAALLAVFLR